MIPRDIVLLNLLYETHTLNEARACPCDTHTHIADIFARRMSVTTVRWLGMSGVAFEKIKDETRPVGVQSCLIDFMSSVMVIVGVESGIDDVVEKVRDATQKTVTRINDVVETFGPLRN